MTPEERYLDLSFGARPEQVECSCGLRAMLHFTGQKYVALAAGWKYRTLAEAEEYEANSGRRIAMGWYCGQPDHEQVVKG